MDPKEPDAKVKFLAAEALRGVGGMLLDANGDRFCDELGHRDYVTGLMWKNKGPFRLVLNGAASKEIEWHCKHYVGRGLMKRFTHAKELAADMGIPVSKLEQTFAKYNQAAKDKKCPFGKKYFHNLPFKADDIFHVAIVTPVLHFTMGGLEINDEGQVLAGKSMIPGLFACGEVAGGVHGANRLGGSSLLGCVVFGRVAGASATRLLLDRLSQGQGVGAVGGGSGPNVKVQVQPQGTINLEISWNGATGAPVVGSAKPAAAKAAAPAAAKKAEAPKRDTSKEITVAEVAKHNTEKDCWVVINGQVLDCTNFLKDHPGGKKAILLFAGKDASEEFNMLHKPDVIQKYAPDTVIGVVKGGAKGKSSL